MVSYRKRCKPEKLVYAKRMREKKTRAERILWGILYKVYGKHHHVKDVGFKWRQQAIILGFIVDFYCPAAKLIVEVDGSVHDGRKEYDERRDLAISQKGFKILRFKNEDVYNNLKRVRAIIFDEMFRRLKNE